MHTELTEPSVHEKLKEFYKFFPDKMEIYDITGRRVCHQDAGVRGAGESTLTWDACNSYGRQCSSGVYFLRVTAENECERGKFVLVR